MGFELTLSRIKFELTLSRIKLSSEEPLTIPTEDIVSTLDTLIATRGSGPGILVQQQSEPPITESHPFRQDHTTLVNSPETPYFCVAARDGSLCRPWSLVEHFTNGGGARLEVDDPHQVPDCFTLVHQGAAPTAWKCRVIWRSESHIGVRFEGRSELCEEAGDGRKG